MIVLLYTFIKFHTLARYSIFGVLWWRGTRKAAHSVSTAGFSGTTSVVCGTLVDICINKDKLTKNYLLKP